VTVHPAALHRFLGYFRHPVLYDEEGLGVGEAQTGPPEVMNIMIRAYRVGSAEANTMLAKSPRRPGSPPGYSPAPKHSSPDFSAALHILSGRVKILPCGLGYGPRSRTWVRRPKSASTRLYSATRVALYSRDPGLRRPAARIRGSTAFRRTLLQPIGTWFPLTIIRCPFFFRKTSATFSADSSRSRKSNAPHLAATCIYPIPQKALCPHLPPRRPTP